MKAAMKRKWVKALLSGRYVQGKGRLADNGKHCCLGVLNEVCLLGSTPILGYLDVEALDMCGLDHSEQRALANLNDARIPFEVIAGVIEETL